MKRLGCGHVFHATCVDLWGETAHTCPLCKTDFAELAREAANATAGGAAAGGVGAAPAAAPAGAPPPARRPNRWFRGFTMLRTVEDPRGRSSSSENWHAQHNATVGSEDDDDDNDDTNGGGGGGGSGESDSPGVSPSEPLGPTTSGGAPALSRSDSGASITSAASAPAQRMASFPRNPDPHTAADQSSGNE